MKSLYFISLIFFLASLLSIALHIYGYFEFQKIQNKPLTKIKNCIYRLLHKEDERHNHLLRERKIHLGLALSFIIFFVSIYFLKIYS